MTTEEREIAHCNEGYMFMLGFAAGFVVTIIIIAGLIITCQPWA